VLCFAAMAMALLAAVATLLFPGFGQGLAGRARRTAVWALLGIATQVTIMLSVWSLAVLVVVRFASAIDAFVCLRRARGLGVNAVLVVVAVVVSFVGSLATRLFAVEAFKNPSSSMVPNIGVGDHTVVDKLSLRWRAPERGEVIIFEYPCDPSRTYVKRVIGVGGDAVEVRCNVVYVNGTPIPAQLVEDGHRCSYQDYIESGPAQGWQARPCSRYRETLNGHTYDVLHDDARPDRDRELAAGTLHHGDSRDFPFEDHLPGCANASDDDSTAVPQTRGKLVETKTKSDAAACEQQIHFVVPAGEFFVLGDNRFNSNDSRVYGTVKPSAVRGRLIGTWYPFDHFGAMP
jgi:signal peptidase I